MRPQRKTMSAAIIILTLIFELSIFKVSATSSTWAKPRPSTDRTFDETIGNAQTDNVASVGIGVNIGKYSENDSSYDYNDHLNLKVSVSANSREGIDYHYDDESESYRWINVTNPTGITGDDSGANISIPLSYPCPILFYGVKYTSVWVCSNGFLSFDCNRNDPNPSSIPNSDKPNTIIAPFWRDLKPNLGGSITYGVAPGLFGGYNAFVVSWNNVPDVSGNKQSFQVVIQMWDSDVLSNVHHLIFFQYLSITNGPSTSIGIEN